LIAGDAGPGPAQHRLAQLTGPACAADLIDQLCAAGTVLTYDPDEKTLRAGDRDALTVVTGQDRQQRASQRRTA